MTDAASAAPTYQQIVASWNARADHGNQWDDLGEDEKIEWAVACAKAAPPAVVEPLELSPDFTDTARAALLWVLWHHQGGSSPVGQPIRFALGMGQHDRLNEHQLSEAKRWERLHPVNPSVFQRGTVPLTCLPPPTAPRDAAPCAATPYWRLSPPARHPPCLCRE